MIHRDEATKASSLSPGVVLNDEELLREVYEHHLDGDRIRYSAVTAKKSYDRTGFRFIDGVM